MDDQAPPFQSQSPESPSQEVIGDISGVKSPAPPPPTHNLADLVNQGHIINIPDLGAQTKPFITGEPLIRNKEASDKRLLPKFHLWIKHKKVGGRIAVIAGGPSLNDYIDEIRGFNGALMVAGSPHDHVIRQGIRPNYCVIYDPSSDHVHFLRETDRKHKITYLVAATCCPEIFDHLAKCRIVTWVGAGDIPESAFNGELAVVGGSSTPLRAWMIAYAMGYRDIHFFGLDSSFPENVPSQHAYGYDGFEHHLPGAFRVRVNGEHEFLTNPTLISEAQQFVKMLRFPWPEKCEFTVHGEGLIAAIIKGSQWH